MKICVLDCGEQLGSEIELNSSETVIVDDLNFSSEHFPIYPLEGIRYLNFPFSWGSPEALMGEYDGVEFISIPSIELGILGADQLGSSCPTTRVFYPIVSL